MDSQLDKFAQNVAAEVYTDDNNKAIDPLTIIMLVNLAITIGKLIYECVKERRKDVIAHPNTMERVAFRLMVMRQVGVVDFAKIKGNKLVTAMMAQAAALSDADLEALLGEIDNSVI